MTDTLRVVVVVALVSCTGEPGRPASLMKSFAGALAEAAVPAASVVPVKGSGPGEGEHRPLAAARRAGKRIGNREASIPSPCYTKTDGVSNPCWTCHTKSTYPNLRSDEDLQRAYSFSAYGSTNRWSNLFIDRSSEIAVMRDDEILAYVREDNYAAARRLLQGEVTQWAFPFDLDLVAGFDEQGFARDGSQWRAFRYKPFPGTFWPTNGSTDDAMIRLPRAFRSHDGEASTMVYRVNLAVLEASLAADPTVADADVWWPTETLDETVAAIDLDGNGELQASVHSLHGLPTHFVGDAAAHPVRRGTYPRGTEFLHTVRYIDPDAPNLVARRLKELRYMHKEQELARRYYFSQYAEEAHDKDAGVLPRYGGNAETGLRNPFGWRIQGYIEDAQGRLRLQTYEEHHFCMGCHSGIGVTADSTFAFPRKVPGASGWAYQEISDIPDVPQLGHARPEVLTYFERVGGGDELRANTEILAKFFVAGELDEAAVRRAAVGADVYLPWLVAPSRDRALALDKAYRVLVRTQSFAQGRDTLLAPPANVHRTIDNGSTGLQEAARVFLDGNVRLDWRGSAFWRE